MNPETIIAINITATSLLVGLSAFFSSLLAIIWKGKSEIRSTIKEELASFIEDSKMFKHNIKAISDHLTNGTRKKFDPSELKAHSPYQLTQKGLKLVKEDMEFNKTFKSHKKDFFNIIDKESASTKYDVEIAAIKSIIVLSDMPYMKFLKIFLYNHPKRDIQNVAPTLGIYVRDM